MLCARERWAFHRRPAQSRPAIHCRLPPPPLRDARSHRKEGSEAKTLQRRGQLVPAHRVREQRSQAESVLRE
jgi:hypothetical protein